MKKKVFLILTSIILLIGIMFPITKTQADSGWDSSYSSSSSSSSGSSWSSSGSNWSSSSSSSSGSSEDFGSLSLGMKIFMHAFISVHYWAFAFMPLGRIFANGKKAMQISIGLFVARIIIIIIGDILIPIFPLFDFLGVFILAFIGVPICATIKGVNMLSGTKSKELLREYNDVSDMELNNYGIQDKELIKQELYEKYKQIQIAWMNIDYNKMRPLLSDSLYNMYKSQLKTLELKKQKNLMGDFEYIDCKIIDINKNFNKLEIRIYLNVKMYDYVVDKNNKVLRGNDSRKIDIGYEITFEKSINKMPKKCPNCGAPITNNASNECEYCDSTIVSDNHDWVMSKKICVKQK